MAQQNEENVTQQQNTENLSDMEIAEMARTEIANRDKEIARLNKELARQTMYTQVDNTEAEQPKREQVIEQLSRGDITNYDYWTNVLALRQIELNEGREDPLGKHGEDVAKFVKGIIDECGDDHTSFSALYTARLGKDRPEDLAAYNKALKLK